MTALTSTTVPDGRLAEEIAAGHGKYLGQIARVVPPSREDKAVTPSCVFRWVTEGVRVLGGGRVRLEAMKLAGRFISTPMALARFLEAQTPQASSESAPGQSSPGKRLKAAERAGAELDKLGI